jgi:hypothetical protein
MTEGGPKEKIEAALANAGGPLSLDQICQEAFGRVTEEFRSKVRVNLHRLDAAGRLAKYRRAYELKR